MSATPLPTLTARARASLHHARLVRELATGANPEGTPERALCAAHLVAPRHRQELAASLEDVVESAMGPWPGLSAAAPLARGQIRAARDELLDLAARLRTGRDVTPRGAALVEELLHDGSSPIYAKPEPEDLDAHARATRVALDASVIAA